MGSLALSLCHLAAGRVDAVCSLKPARSVDIAAAQLLVRERGLPVSLSTADVRGRAARPRRPLADRRCCFTRGRRACRSRAGRVTDVRIGCSGLELRPLAPRRLLPEAPARAALARVLRAALRHRRGQRDLLPPAARVAVARWVEQTPPRLPVRGQGEPLPHAREAAARPAPRHRALLRADRAARPLAEARPACSGSCPDVPARRRAARGRARRAAAGRHCFEFRHESWFADDVYELLRRHGVALVIGDRPQRPFQRTS